MQIESRRNEETNKRTRKFENWRNGLSGEGRDEQVREQLQVSGCRQLSHERNCSEIVISDVLTFTFVQSTLLASSASLAWLLPSLRKPAPKESWVIVYVCRVSRSHSR